MALVDDRDLDATFLVSPISGYTALTEAHGDSRAADAVARYWEFAQAALVPPARIVERAGDEILFVSSPGEAAVEAVEREPLFPTIRAGLHRGGPRARWPLLRHDVDVASRVASHTRGGQISGTRSVH